MFCDEKVVLKLYVLMDELKKWSKREMKRIKILELNIKLI